MRGMKPWSFARGRFSLTLKLFPQTTGRVTKKSGSEHMKSIWNVAPCQARNLMIGCKPNANSSMRHAKRRIDRKSTRLNSSHQIISYAVFCLKKKKNDIVHQA